MKVYSVGLGRMGFNHASGAVITGSAYLIDGGATGGGCRGPLQP